MSPQPTTQPAEGNPTPEPSFKIGDLVVVDLKTGEKKPVCSVSLVESSSYVLKDTVTGRLILCDDEKDLVLLSEYEAQSTEEPSKKVENTVSSSVNISINVQKSVHTAGAKDCQQDGSASVSEATPHSETPSQDSTREDKPKQKAPRSGSFALDLLYQLVEDARLKETQQQKKKKNDATNEKQSEKFSGEEVNEIWQHCTVDRKLLSAIKLHGSNMVCAMHRACPDTQFMTMFQTIEFMLGMMDDCPELEELKKKIEETKTKLKEKYKCALCDNAREIAQGQREGPSVVMMPVGRLTGLLSLLE